MGVIQKEYLLAGGDASEVYPNHADDLLALMNGDETLDVVQARRNESTSSVRGGRVAATDTVRGGRVATVAGRGGRGAADSGRGGRGAAIIRGSTDIYLDYDANNVDDNHEHDEQPSTKRQFPSTVNDIGSQVISTII